MPLNTTVYSAYPRGQDAAQAISSLGNDGFLSSGPFLSDFHEYLKSNTRLNQLYPEIKLCYTAWMSGAPSIKMRVSVLTTTEHSTIKSTGIYTGSKNGDMAPKTANPVQPGLKASPLPTIKAPPRSTMPVVRPSTIAESDGSKSIVPPEPPPRLPGSKPNSNLDSRPSGLAPEPAPSPKPDNQKSYTTYSEDGPPPIGIALNQPNPQPPKIQVEGSTCTADSAFDYVIGTKTLAPGSTPVVVNSVRNSLAPFATALFAGTRSIALHPGESSPAVLTMGNEIYTADSHSRVVIGSQTLVAGGPTVSIDHTPYYLAASPTTPDLSEPYKAPILSITAQTYKLGPSLGYVINGQTLKTGDPPITVSGVDYALATSAKALISGGTTITPSFPQPQPSNLLNIGGIVYTEDLDSNFVVDSQTLVPGGSPVTINRTPYSLISGPSGIALVIGSKTSYLSPMMTNAALIKIGASFYTANAASEFLVGSQTLVPGGSAITIDRTPYSLYMGPSGEALVVGSSTSFFLGPTPTAFYPPAVITIDSSLYTANPKSEFVIDGQTLSPEHAITINHTTYSLHNGPSGEALVVGFSTSFFGPPRHSGVTAAPAAVITAGSALYTADAKSEFIIGTQTLSPGGHAITVSGTRISLGALGTNVVVGTSTEAINLASFIMQGFRHAATAGPATTSTTTGAGAGGGAQATGFTGGANNKAWGGKVAERWAYEIMIFVLTIISITGNLV